MLVNRSLATCIILSIITCGIYSFFWIANIHNEFARVNNEDENGWLVVVLSIVTCGIYGLVWFYKMGSKLEKLGGKNDAVLYIILAILGLGIVSLALIQVQENELCEKNS